MFKTFTILIVITNCPNFKGNFLLIFKILTNYFIGNQITKVYNEHLSNLFTLWYVESKEKELTEMSIQIK